MRTAVLAVLITVACSAAPAAAQDLAVRAGTLHTGAGEPIADGMVWIVDGVIRAVGPAESIALPDGVEVIEVPVATPGLIDARSTVGLSGAMNQPHDQDQLERSAPIQPELRAIDAYNPRERLVGWLREHGITTLHTGHGPGELISGQTLIAKTRGETVDEAVIVPSFGLSATLGPAATGHDRSTPGNRSKAVALLRAKLIEARGYAERQDAGRDLALEALVEVLDGARPLIVAADHHVDILAALRLADEFGVRLILASASDAHLVVDEIRAAGVPVLLHPTMIRAWGGSERANFSFTTARTLLDAGIPVALQSDFEGYVPKTRVVLFEAGLLLGYGLDVAEALALVTSAPAAILGIDDRVGTLEVGKDGDVALFDGNPFEYTTHVLGTVIEGVRVSDVRR
ncbi:amidohydrolase family protein [Wenzhouxiangella sp. XN79A]|nr:amidohydrolase family protein [Wenzhouxiangella sp. XN79A]